MKNQITGKTNVYGIIGDPIEHSFSPIMHNTISKILGIEYVYVPFHVLESDLEKAISGAYSLNIKGLNVTIPHKNNVMKYIKKLDESGKLVGSVNTLKYSENGYIGYNTDIYGIEKTFEIHNIYLENKNIVIFGAGGSSYAAAIAAAKCSPKKIYIVNRTEKNGLKILKHVKNIYDTPMEVLSPENIHKIEKPEIVVQTTSVGFGALENFSPVVDEKFFKNVEFALEMIYTPWETEFLKMAKKFGVRCVNGFEVLVYQGLASYEIWHDVKISEKDIEDIYSELLNLLKIN